MRAGTDRCSRARRPDRPGTWARERLGTKGPSPAATPDRGSNGPGPTSPVEVACGEGRPMDSADEALAPVDSRRRRVGVLEANPSARRRVGATHIRSWTPCRPRTIGRHRRLVVVVVVVGGVNLLLARVWARSLGRVCPDGPAMKEDVGVAHGVTMVDVHRLTGAMCRWSRHARLAGRRDGDDIVGLSFRPPSSSSSSSSGGHATVRPGRSTGSAMVRVGVQGGQGSPSRR